MSDDISMLKDSAMYGSPSSFSKIMTDISQDREYLYQEMAEAAAITGNLPVIQYIMGEYMIDSESVAVVARTHGYYDVAVYLTGEALVPFKRDMPAVEDMEEDRSKQAEYWQNSGYWVAIKTDTPIEENDVSKKRKIMGTRRWGWRGDNLDVPTTTNTWIIRP